ncbi:MAG: glucuronate isomerase [Saprospiraceae bacterium]|nr:glucuronate isomerase [Saprospiraceae bacterium]
MKEFLDDHFLLESPTSQQLFHDYARDLPIIDYHCHLSPDDIAANRQFENLTKIWLDGDHYKWRAMRTMGINEKYITGDAPDHEKFRKWASVVPYTVRNPLFHWTHLELRRYFNIEDALTEESAQSIYGSCNDLLQQPEFSVQSLLRKMKVEVVCTTDDPTDDLVQHDTCTDLHDIQVLPAFRPDHALFIGSAEFLDYLGSLEDVTQTEIRSFDSLLAALESRMDHFHQRGGRIADHGLETIPSVLHRESEVAKIFAQKLRGGLLSPDEVEVYQSALLYQLCIRYHQRGWIQQFHLGALRNNSYRMSKLLGKDTGFDSIGDFPQALALSCFLDRLDMNDTLTKTVIYNLNPADNAVIASMIGNFNDGSTKGKIQYGSAWWFLDQKDGMENQINALSNMGLVSCFIGMLTDSRSFMSYPRHEYFRRILCNIFGHEIETGQLPSDMAWIGKIISDICYYNAKQYFNFS